MIIIETTLHHFIKDPRMTTYAELQAQIKKLQEQAEQVKAKELETVVADIKKKISEYGLTAEQLGFSSATGKTSKRQLPKKAP